MERWSGGVVEWWSGGVVEWWSGGVAEWWSGGSRIHFLTLVHVGHSFVAGCSDGA